MKTKFLISFISFIFLFTLYSNTLYAVTNEILEMNETIEEIKEEETEDEVENNDIEDEIEAINEEKTEEQVVISNIIEESVVASSEINYRGKMNLEDPTYNQNFTRPNETKVAIRGWAVSDDANASLRLLVDGNVVSTKLTRSGRGDVDSLVSPSYGGVSATPKAGFNGTIDISDFSAGNHTIEVQELSRYGEVITFYQTPIKIANKKYQGKMNLEDPTYNQNFTRPNDTKVTLRGWAVSDDANASLRLLIDGNVVSSQLSRSGRGDVDSLVSPSYGGVSATPKAGFNGTIDISDFSAGNHTIEVQELSRYGEIIASYQMPIKIANKKYQGKMNLEDPTYNQSFTRPDNNKVTIRGWAVSDDANASLRLLVDGNVVTTNLSRSGRGDVDSLVSPFYGGTATTLKAGFNGTIDISDFSAGNHTIEVQEISRYGEVITFYQTPIKIANKKYQGKMYIENPTYNQNFRRPNDTKLTLRGWAVSTDSNASLRLLVDGNVVSTKLTRSGRGDVDSLVSPSYGGVATTPKAGFNGTIDISDFSAGNHTIEVQELSRYGEVITSYQMPIRIANKKYQGKMYIENPTYQQSFIRPNDTKLTLRGWAVSTDNNATLKLLVDGNVIATNLSRSGRGDVDSLVSPSYGGVATTPKAGFNGTVDISNLGVGNHTIEVQEISRYGEVITSYQTPIKIANKKYEGEMWVDTPTNKQSYNVGENITISGWAVSQDELATVEIYIDGNWKARADRYNRGDVVFYMNKYDGKTINAGFGKMINSSGMSAGTHNITVYEKSRYGDVIGGIQVQITIKAPTTTNNTQSSKQSDVTNNNSNPTKNILTSGTKGIDVSQFQGTIDWKKVADSDIKYAMIRIGYRGYGTGGFAEDTKFKTNFSNAVANGLKVGVYFYSTAINIQEAKADAEYVMSILKKYGYQNKVSMPIAIDLELVSGVNTRDQNVSKVTRTNIANTFCGTIAGYGYTPMVYACKAFLNDNMNASQISYDVWVAQYNSKCTYTGKYTMWQYTSTGKVSGINGNVDCNICYKNY